ncbi:MAG: YhbY family RNA-binding protein [Planctomycetota bacterium]|nr:YhbY family RNA-binding protein [Planctomycetota bacterium]
MGSDLTHSQRKFLRSSARTRRPDVIIGKGGVNEKTLKHVLAQLARRELVKIRLLESAGDDRVAAAERIAQGAGAVLVELVGRIAVLYKPNDQLDAAKRLQLPEH